MTSRSRSQAMYRSSAVSLAVRKVPSRPGILAESGHGRSLGIEGVHQDIGRRKRLVCRHRWHTLTLEFAGPMIVAGIDGVGSRR